MAAIRHVGGWGSALKSRDTEREQWEASLGRSTDIDLYHNNLLHHLCSGYFQGGSQRHAWRMAGETSINTAKLEAKDSICFVSRALRRQNLLQLDMNYLDSDKRQLQVFFNFHLIRLKLLKYGEFIKIPAFLW